VAYIILFSKIIIAILSLKFC